jgi:hypothetical protein
MPENEFEKKIASEMKELKFTPSASVWPQVEERIRKKKDRRIFILIFLLAGLALLGWWQWNNFFGEKENEIVKTETKTKEKEEINTEITEEEVSSSTVIENKSTETENNISKTNKKEATDSEPASDKKTISTTINTNKKPEEKSVSVNQKFLSKTNNNPVKKQNPEKQAPAEELQRADISTAQSGSIKDAVSKIAVTDTAKKDIEETKQPEIKPADQKPEQKADSAKAAEVISPEIKKEEIKDSAAEMASLKDDVITSKEIKKATDKKWKWGAQFIPGISFLNESIVSLNMLKSADAQNYQSPSGSGGSAAPPRQLPSDVRPGFGFQLGGFLQKETSKRTNISFGLQYGFYSHRIGIGGNRDSLRNLSNQFAAFQDAVTFYNAGGDTMKYINRYHFLELPFRFQWQINKNKTQPVYWSFGFSVSQLISTNAIQYDTIFNGIYYQNKNLLNKTQFSLNTGFSFTLANNRRMQWNLGPYASLHLNKLVDNPFEKKKHLFFAGLRSSVIFKRK